MLLAEAKKANPHVPAFLTGKKKMPNRLPDMIGFGDESEAISYVGDHGSGWKSTPKVVLRSNTPFNGVKVFSATMYKQRDQLGEKVTEWIAAKPKATITEFVVTQSSDALRSPCSIRSRWRVTDFGGGSIQQADLWRRSRVDHQLGFPFGGGAQQRIAWQSGAGLCRSELLVRHPREHAHER